MLLTSSKPDFDFLFNVRFLSSVKIATIFYNKCNTKLEEIAVEPKIAGTATVNKRVETGNADKERTAAVSPIPIDKALIVQTTAIMPPLIDESKL